MLLFMYSVFMVSQSTNTPHRLINFSLCIFHPATLRIFPCGMFQTPDSRAKSLCRLFADHLYMCIHAALSAGQYTEMDSTCYLLLERTRGNEPQHMAMFNRFAWHASHHVARILPRAAY